MREKLDSEVIISVLALNIKNTLGKKSKHRIRIHMKYHLKPQSKPIALCNYSNIPLKAHFTLIAAIQFIQIVCLMTLMRLFPIACSRLIVFSSFQKAIFIPHKDAIFRFS